MVFVASSRQLMFNLNPLQRYIHLSQKTIASLAEKFWTRVYRWLIENTVECADQDVRRSLPVHQTVYNSSASGELLGLVTKGLALVAAGAMIQTVIADSFNNSMAHYAPIEMVYSLEKELAVATQSLATEVKVIQSQTTEVKLLEADVRLLATEVTQLKLGMLSLANEMKQMGSR